MPSITLTVEGRNGLVFHVTQEMADAIVELATMGSLSEKFLKKKRETETAIKQDRRNAAQDKWATRLS